MFHVNRICICNFIYKVILPHVIKFVCECTFVQLVSSLNTVFIRSVFIDAKIHYYININGGQHHRLSDSVESSYFVVMYTFFHSRSQLLLYRGK